ncbi:hypothetical protein PHLGIDRAFT_477768 [Phlebiopsis gigantea 11061_1 CR5-6]|uniref:Uncharacterized protein n=1 Tax=Phlebiopsis gigantea (strain 11061_1 CR5-6) TaxID=745531 RepID=A0A0C3RWN8_PHLG1|nr:hypothetical protein PHLGIDRAFT_477768 [Phlebiopsis gigantea 11061_1 CR5-6]
MSDEQTPSAPQTAKSEGTTLARVLNLDDTVELCADSVRDEARPEIFSQYSSPCQDNLKILQLRSRKPGTFEFVAETWKFDANSRPTLEHTESHLIDPSSLGHVTAETASITNLDEEGRLVRIGSAFYREDATGSFTQSNPLSKTSWSRVPERVSGIASRGDVLVLAGRKPIETEVDTRSDEENFTYDDSDDESEASSVDSDDEAYESWSECSEDDSERDHDSDKSSIKEAEEDEGVGEDEDDELDDKDEESASSSEALETEDDSGSESDEGESSEGDESLRPSRASISVFTPTGRTFHRSQKVVPPLFDSGPVIHPTKSLVVWAMGEDILFGDYETKTFYTRSAWSMGYACEGRSIFMKCRFSPCGRYLHVASLDGEHTDDEGEEPALSDPMKLTLAVYTHRLCDLKPSRCRPNLMHTVWIELGNLDCVNFNKPPCTLTWTDKHVYATLSDTALRVHRIPLFHEPSKNEVTAPQAYKPKELITLPECARSRQVLFFPAVQNETAATIVVGDPLARKGESVASDADAGVPLAFRVDEQEDFGGWVDYKPPEEGKSVEKTKSEVV